MVAADRDAEPIASDERDALFGGLATATGIVAAVSGGPDSTALMHLLAAWRAQGGRPPVVVATVDHGLRPEAGGEARQVEQAAALIGLPHHTLVWTGPKPAAGLQEAAREARYRRLVDLAGRLGASHLATAHTLDDQAETVLIRLAMGSGIAGLAGMRPSVEVGGLVHVRPFLAVPKRRLVATCRANGWPFVDDPSNVDDRFARSRWRRLMPLLAAQGLTAARLAQLATRARRTEDALEAKAGEALRRARRGEAGGGPRFEAAPFAREPFEVALRMLAAAVQEARPGSGGAPFMRLRRLEACLGALREAIGAGRPMRRTIAGTLLSLDRSGLMGISAEPPRRRGRSAAAEDSAAAAPHSLGKGVEHA